MQKTATKEMFVFDEEYERPLLVIPASDYNPTPLCIVEHDSGDGHAKRCNVARLTVLGRRAWEAQEANQKRAKSLGIPRQV